MPKKTIVFSKNLNKLHHDLVMIEKAMEKDKSGFLESTQDLVKQIQLIIRTSKDVE